MYKVIGRFEEDGNGIEREKFEDLVKELGLIGNLSEDVGKVVLYYDEKGNTYAVAEQSEEYYGLNSDRVSASQG